MSFARFVERNNFFYRYFNCNNEANLPVFIKAPCSITLHKFFKADAGDHTKSFQGRRNYRQ